MQPQSFLPYLTPSGQVLGVLVIPTTTFSGNEATFNAGTELAPILYPLVRKTYQQVSAPIWQDNKLIDYMAVAVPYEDTRNGMYASNEFLEQTYPFGERWVMAQGYARFDSRPNFLVSFLSGKKLDAFVVTPPVPPTPGEPDVVLTKHLSTQLANAPLCSFFDVNWVALFEIESGDANVATITILPPTDDPSGSNALKAFVVQSNPVRATVDGILLNTLRFVKTEVLPVGDYVYPVEFRNSSGLTASGTLTITVS